MIPIAKPLIGEEEKKAVLEVLDSGMLAQGAKVAEFEENFAKYIGVDHAVATTNGTQALMIAMHALGVKGRVAVPSFTFFSSVSSIMSIGAKPVFTEVHEGTFNFDASTAPEADALLPVHLYGQPCDMSAIMELAEKKNIPVIEDACQSHGAHYKDKRVGSFGVGCFSFYPTKNMTSGEGGMVTTNDKKLAEKMKLFRDHGQSERYVHKYEGYNFRMTEINAAIGIEQLKKLDGFNEQRKKNAEFYNKELKGVEIPVVAENCEHVYHVYTVKVAERDRFAEHLKKNGVGYGMYYPIPVHKQPFINSGDSLPITEKLCKEVISLPVHPSLSKDELKTVVEAVNSFS